MRDLVAVIMHACSIHVVIEALDTGVALIESTARRFCMRLQSSVVQDFHAQNTQQSLNIKYTHDDRIIIIIITTRSAAVGIAPGAHIVGTAPETEHA